MSLIFFITLAGWSFSESTTITLTPGDNLFRLTLKTGIPVEVLKRLNNITDETKLLTGQKIVIPKTHTVSRGETLFSLSREWKIRIQDLKMWNGLKGDILPVGQKLYFLSPLENSRPPIVEERKTPPPPAVTPSGTLTPEPGEKKLKLEQRPINSEPLGVNSPFPGFRFSAVQGPFASVTAGTVIFQDVNRELGRIMLVETSEGNILGYAGFDSTDLALGAAVKVGQHLGVFTKSGGALLFFAFSDGKPLKIQWGNR